MEENNIETKEELKEKNKETVVKKERKKKSDSKENLKKVTVNNRFSDVLDKIEIEAEKQKKAPKKEVEKEEKTENKRNNEKKSNTKNKETNKKENKKQVKLKENINKKNKEEDKEISKKTSSKKTQELQLTKDNERLKEIENAIKEQKEMPKPFKEKMNKRIFENIFIANLIILYFMFVYMGSVNIDAKAFIVDLQVFSITLILGTIVIFEKAYKKDSGRITIHGIEVLFLSIITMLLPLTFKKHTDIFGPIVCTISYAYAIYYVAKSIIIYVKANKKNRKSDIKKISKK